VLLSRVLRGPAAEVAIDRRGPAAETQHRDRGADRGHATDLVVPAEADPRQRRTGVARQQVPLGLGYLSEPAIEEGVRRLAAAVVAAA
jgi:hypothetical protein